MPSSYTPRLAKNRQSQVDIGMKKEMSEVSPLLGMLMLGSWAFAIMFFSSMHPSQIRDVFVPYSYLPAVVMIACVGYLSGSYFGRSTRRGIFVAIGASMSFWLLLRGIAHPLALLYIITPFFLIELVLTITKER